MKIKELSELICDECKENKDRVCIGDKKLCERQRKLYLIGELQ